MGAVARFYLFVRNENLKPRSFCFVYKLLLKMSEEESRTLNLRKGPPKRSERRTSILKPSNREPLQDVANQGSSKSPDIESTLTFNFGGQKSTRRSSFGRRVSFSAAAKVKEFRRDDLSLWNSTYEEERSNLNSDSSSATKSGESDVFMDKTFVGNDDMETTEVIVKPDSAQVQASLMEKFGSKSSKVCSNTNTTVGMDMTKVGSETLSNEDEYGMEITGMIQKTEANQGLSLKEKFGSKSTQICSNTIVNMDMTRVGPETRDFNKSAKVTSSNCNFEGNDMEITGVISKPEANQVLSSLREKFGSKSSKISPNNTVNSEVPLIHQTFQTSANKTIVGTDENMEMTEAIPAVQKMQKSSNKKVASIEDNMEMTEAIPAILRPLKRSNSNQEVEGINDNIGMTGPIPPMRKPLKKNNTNKTIMGNDENMEMTGIIPRLQEPSQRNKTNKSLIGNDENMEMTEAIPTIQKVMQKVNANETEVNFDKNMELTGMMIPVIPKSSQKSEVDGINKTIVGSDDHMELTEAIPAIQKPLQKYNTNKAVVNIDENMEMTEMIPVIPKTFQKDK